MQKPEPSRRNILPKEKRVLANDSANVHAKNIIASAANEPANEPLSGTAKEISFSTLSFYFELFAKR